jgi:hypothetical protein
MWSRNHCFLTAKLTKKKKTKKVKTGITSIRKTYEYDSYIIYNGLINLEVSASKMNLNQIRTFYFAKLATIQGQRKTMLPALLHIRPEFMKGPNMQVSLAGLSSLR